MRNQPTAEYLLNRAGRKVYRDNWLRVTCRKCRRLFWAADKDELYCQKCGGIK